MLKKFLEKNSLPLRGFFSTRVKFFSTRVKFFSTRVKKEFLKYFPALSII